MKSKAQYTFEIIDDVICIVDLNQGAMSVTNDAEAVVAEILEAHPEAAEYPIVYQDSEGIWDAIKIIDDTANFQAIRATERAVAICAVKELNKVAGNAAEEAARAFDLIGLPYDKDALKIWADICDREELKFTPGLLYADEPPQEVLRRIAEAGRVMFFISPGQPVNIFIDLNLLKG